MASKWCIVSTSLVGLSVLGSSLVGSAQAQTVPPSGPSMDRPDTLVIQPEDLPEALVVAAADGEEAGHSAIYFGPDAPEPGALWSVMAHVRVFADLDAGITAMAAPTAPADLGSAVPTAGEQRLLGSIELTAEGTGADQGVLFRVESEIQGLHAVECRYRLRVGRAVTDLVIVARMGLDGGEPAGFRELARTVAARQVDRLRGAVDG